MGTSASSMGPGAGVSLDPEWLDDIKLPNQDNEQPDCQNDDDSENLMKKNRMMMKNLLLHPNSVLQVLDEEWVNTFILGVKTL